MAGYGTQITIRIKGIPQAQRKLAYKNLASSPLREFLLGAGEVIKTNLQSHINVWQGDTRDSFEVMVSQAAIAKWIRIGTDSPVATFLEEGTGPGYFPNVDNITPWAEDHDIAPWSLARHILDFGTKAHPFVDDALESSMPALFGLVAKMGLDIEVQAMKG